MSFLKENRNAFRSFVSYLIAFAPLSGMHFGQPYPKNILMLNPLLSGVSLVLVLFGIFSGFRCTKAKESAWAGYVAVVAGLLMLLFAMPIIFEFLLAFTPI